MLTRVKVCYNRPMEKVRILHTSDVHLGARFEKMGAQAPEFRALLQKTFTKIVDLAITQKANCLVIAGDLFDSGRPTTAVISFLSGQLRRLSEAGIAVAMIAGNHDLFDTHSVYRRAEWYNFPGVHFLYDKNPIVEIPSLSLAIFGTSCTTKKSRTSPLAPLIPLAKHSAYQNTIALIHGSLTIPEKHAVDDYPFSAKEISESPFAYVACGNWHSGFEVVKDRAWFSGAPEALSTQQSGAGSVVMIDIADGVVQRIARQRVGETEFSRLTLPVEPETQLEDLVQEIAKGAHRRLVRKVSLVGLVYPQQRIPVQAILDELSRRFYHLSIEDKTHIELTDDALQQFPEELVIGQYVRMLKDKIEHADDPNEKRKYEEALQLGVALLTGEEAL